LPHEIILKGKWAHERELSADGRIFTVERKLGHSCVVVETAIEAWCLGGFAQAIDGLSPTEWWTTHRRDAPPVLDDGTRDTLTRLLQIAARKEGASRELRWFGEHFLPIIGEGAIAELAGRVDLVGIRLEVEFGRLMDAVIEPCVNNVLP
jgi:hypothetical protein